MKNKLIYVFFSVMALLVCFSVSAFAGFDLDEESVLELERVESYDSCLATGDATGDGKITSGDARYILRISVNLDAIDASDFVKADVDGDGKITAADARLALRLAVGLDELPEHKIEEIVVVPATCATEGLTVKLCTSCVKLYATITVPASTDLHILTGWETIELPTCVDSGLAQMKCAACDTVVKETKLSATNKHSGEWNYPDGKSCIDPVKKNRTCTVCGNFEETIENPPAAHNFTWVTIKENSCTEDGLQIYKCKHCGQESTSKTLTAHGHLYERDVVVVEPTCTEKGTQADQCVFCLETTNESDITKLGHDYDNQHYQVTKEPSCSETGTADVICTRCGDAREIELEKTEHTLNGEWSETLAASCTEPGSAEGTCRYCGPVTKEIPATGHTVKNWVNVKPAKCNEEGLKTGYCSTCGNEAAEEAIEMIPHTYNEKDNYGRLVIHHTSGILCKEDGEGYILCTACGYKKMGIITCIGKCEKGESRIKTEATCTENETTVDICRYCNEEISGSTKTNYNTKLGHNWGEWEDTVEATCAENGLRERECSRCHDTMEEPIAAPGHTPGEWEVIREATCSLTEIKHLSCTVCNQVIQKAENDTLPHTPKNIVIADSASVNEDGHYIVKCKVICAVCSEVISEDEAVTRIAVDSDIDVTFTEDCDVNPGGEIFFTVGDGTEDIIVSIAYGKGGYIFPEINDGVYSFTIPENISDSETITIVVSIINS